VAFVGETGPRVGLRSGQPLQDIDRKRRPIVLDDGVDIGGRSVCLAQPNGHRDTSDDRIRADGRVRKAVDGTDETDRRRPEEKRWA